MPDDAIGLPGATPRNFRSGSFPGNILVWRESARTLSAFALELNVA